MSTAIGLSFRLSASIAQFEKSMERVDRRLDMLDKSSRKTAAGVSVLKNLAIGQALIGGAQSLIGTFQSLSSTVTATFNTMRSEVDAVGKLSSQLGIAVEQLQVFSFAAGLAGVENEALSTALRKLTQRTGEAQMGIGEAGKTFAMLGIDVGKFAAMGADQQFLLIAKAISAIPEPAQRAAVATKLFEEAGVKLLPLLQTNFAAVAEEAKLLGMILSDTQVRDVEKMNDSFTTVYETVKGIGSQIMANVAPAITTINGMILEAVKNFAFDGEVGGPAIAKYLTQAFFDGAEVLAKWADALLAGLVKFAEVMGAIVQKIYEVAKYLFGFSDFSSPQAQALEPQLRAAEASLAAMQSQQGDFWRGDLETRMQRIAEAERQRDDVLQKITAAEEAYHSGQVKAVTGISSIADAVVAARQKWDVATNSGGGFDPKAMDVSLASVRDVGPVMEQVASAASKTAAAHEKAAKKTAAAAQSMASDFFKEADSLTTLQMMSVAAAVELDKTGQAAALLAKQVPSVTDALKKLEEAARPKEITSNADLGFSQDQLNRIGMMGFFNESIAGGKQAWEDAAKQRMSQLQGMTNRRGQRIFSDQFLEQQMAAERDAFSAQMDRRANLMNAIDPTGVSLGRFAGYSNDQLERVAKAADRRNQDAAALEARRNARLGTQGKVADFFDWFNAGGDSPGMSAASPAAVNPADMIEQSANTAEEQRDEIANLLRNLRDRLDVLGTETVKIA
jgi:hypothetical protein